MDKMEFVYGSEKRFDEYVLGLKGKKVALVSHTDLDGIASAKVVDEAINPEFLKFVNYGDLNSKLVGELKRAKVNRVIFTDLMLREQSFITDIEKFSEILVIDHHPSENDFNSKKTVFMNSQDNCGAYLSYYLFSKAKKLEKLDWLVACACLADFFYFKNREFMTKTYEKYGDKFEFKGEFVKMDGKFWEFQYDLSLAISYYLGKEMDLYSRLPEKFGELGGLESAVEEVRKDLNNAKKRFDKEKQVIGDNYFWEVESKYPVKSLIVNELSKKILDKTLIFAKQDGENYFISIRRQDGKVDVGKYLGKLVEGLEGSNAGGHFKAGGGQILYKDKEEFLKRLRGSASK